MKRFTWLVAGLVALGVVSGLGAFAADTPSIDDIMSKAHASKKGLRDQIKVAAEAASPDWAEIQKKSKEFVTLAAALEKNDPPKGDKASWKKLCQEYVTSVKELDAAAGKKDAKALIAANRQLGAGCKGCHDAHRE